MMNNNGTPLLRGMALLFWLAIPLPAAALSARIAVSGDPSLADLVDLTASALSAQPDLAVLDRADLDKLGQEQQIQAVLDSKDYSSIHLLPADGLVLLRAVSHDGKTGILARLVAVQPGVILREVALPDEADPAAQVQALVKELAPYESKLAALQKGRIAALSLLGLRFETDAPGTRDLERSVNLLLANRLSAEPDVLVLERWRLNDAVFEKTLSPQQPAPFWTGSSLIDGSLRLQDGVVEVTLRLRPPQGPDVSITDKDTVENLPALVERLAGKIRNQPAVQTVWNPSAEAAHFAALGKWCLDNHLDEEGAQAIESALALGDNSRTTHMLQVEAYAMQAYPDNLRITQLGETSYISAHLAPDSLPQRIVAATRAAQLMTDYIQANRNFPSLGVNMEDPVDLSVPVLDSCLRILWASHDAGLQTSPAPALADLRHALQNLIAEMGDKMLPPSGTMHELKRDVFLRNRAFYAGLWHETPEDTLAFYREMLKADKDVGTEAHYGLFEGQTLREPHLDGDDQKISLPASWLGPPWIVAWDGRSPDELKTLWQNFLKELAASPDPVLQGDALKFEFNSQQTVGGRNAVLARLVTFIQQHSDSISGPRGEEFVAGLEEPLAWAFRKPGNSAAVNELEPLFERLFRQHVLLPSRWAFQALRFFDSNQPPADNLKSLLAAIDDYGRWYQTQTPQDKKVVDFLTRAHEAAYRARPDWAPALADDATVDYLSVSRFWDAQQLDTGPSATPGHRPAQPVRLDELTVLSRDNLIWFATWEPSTVTGVNPVTSQTAFSYPVPAELSRPAHPLTRSYRQYLEVTPDWIVLARAGAVLLCSRSNSQWRKLDLPPSCYKPCWVGGQLYLLYDAQYGDQHNSPNVSEPVGSGLIRVSLPDGACENLISSRRVPPQNTLDGQPLGIPLNLWMTATTLNLAFLDSPICTSPVGKNTWSRMTTAPIPYRSMKINPGGALINSGSAAPHLGQFALLKESGAQLLLSDTDGGWEFYHQAPLWNYPPDLDNSFPNQMPVPALLMRGEDLCLYYNIRSAAAEGKQALLYYFAKGKKDGIKIPLSFDFKQIDNPRSLKFQTPYLESDGLLATDDGLVLTQSWKGFWMIPWADIDAYRAKHPAGTKPNF